ncbi:hypothetical protein EDC65_3259 [Stella humosa]|uniref:Uncharacterized protein n=2 Tax=Stella humosa TaxID=94 RepID=A0A3N1LJ69_9PROT|nr:hypothetical protein EDC65_3259 [Stella humosa]
MDDCEGQPAVNFRAHVEGTAPRELVSCRIQHAALDMLLTQAAGIGVGDDQSALEAAAEQFRPIILAIATAKFDCGDWLLDGSRKVVVVRLDDVSTAR